MPVTPCYPPILCCLPCKDQRPPLGNCMCSQPSLARVRLWREQQLQPPGMALHHLASDAAEILPATNMIEHAWVYADVSQRTPPPPPAYLSERLLFSAAQLANIDLIANYMARNYWLFTWQGGFYFTYDDASGHHDLLMPFVEPTPDIISLPYDTGSELAELWQVNFEIQGFFNG